MSDSLSSNIYYIRIMYIYIDIIMYNIYIHNCNIYIYTYEWAINHFPIVMHAQVPTFSDEARAALVPEGEGLDGRREPSL